MTADREPKTASGRLVLATARSRSQTERVAAAGPYAELSIVFIEDAVLAIEAEARAAAAREVGKRVARLQEALVALLKLYDPDHDPNHTWPVVKFARAALDGLPAAREAQPAKHRVAMRDGPDGGLPSERRYLAQPDPRVEALLFPDAVGKPTMPLFAAVRDGRTVADLLALTAPAPPPAGIDVVAQAAVDEWNERATGAQGWPAMAELERYLAARLAPQPTADPIRFVDMPFTISNPKRHPTADAE